MVKACMKTFNANRHGVKDRFYIRHDLGIRLISLLSEIEINEYNTLALCALILTGCIKDVEQSFDLKRQSKMTLVWPFVVQSFELSSDF